MISINMPRQFGSVGITARDLQANTVYRVIALAGDDMDGCLAVLTECKDFVIFFGDDNYISSGSVDWATEHKIMFVPTELEMNVHFIA